MQWQAAGQQQMLLASSIKFAGCAGPRCGRDKWCGCQIKWAYCQAVATLALLQQLLAAMVAMLQEQTAATIAVMQEQTAAIVAANQHQAAAISMGFRGSGMGSAPQHLPSGRIRCKVIAGRVVGPLLCCRCKRGLAYHWCPQHAEDTRIGLCSGMHWLSGKVMGAASDKSLLIQCKKCCVRS